MKKQHNSREEATAAIINYLTIQDRNPAEHDIDAIVDATVASDVWGGWTIHASAIALLEAADENRLPAEEATPAARPVPSKIQARADKIAAGESKLPHMQAAPNVFIEWRDGAWIVRSRHGRTPYATGLDLAHALEVADAQHRKNIGRAAAADQSARQAAAGTTPEARAYATGLGHGVAGQVWDED